ncbi:hypothetical protein ARSEF4850_010062, partial [Beauveria asiatica]
MSPSTIHIKRRRHDDEPTDLDADKFEQLYVEWIVDCGVALQMAKRETLRALLNFLNPGVLSILPILHQTVGLLNQPPELLRAALTNIQAEYEMDGHQLEEAIDTAISQKPRLRKNYQRPSDSSDKLFKSGLVHRETDGTACATV